MLAALEVSLAGNGIQHPKTASGDLMLLEEIRHSARALVRVPGLTTISVLTIRSDHVVVVDTQFERQGEQSLVPEYRDLLARVRAMPGVEAAGTIRNLPIAAGQSDGHFYIEGRRAEMGNADAIYSVISPGYLSALRIPLLRGRDFTTQDTETSEPVAIISSEMARVYFPGRDPIGERIWFDSFALEEHWVRIIGVAGDVHQSGLTRPVFPQAYTCYNQQWIGSLLVGGTLTVRTAMPLTSIAAAVRTAIRAVNSDAAPLPRTMDSVIAASVSAQRFQMEILVRLLSLPCCSRQLDFTASCRTW